MFYRQKYHLESNIFWTFYLSGPDLNVKIELQGPTVRTFTSHLDTDTDCCLLLVTTPLFTYGHDTCRLS